MILLKGETVSSGESLQGENVERDKRFLTQKKEYIKGRKWSEVGFSEEEKRVLRAKKGVYKR